jgi:membrane-anchored mycosin MYCP
MRVHRARTMRRVAASLAGLIAAGLSGGPAAWATTAPAPAPYALTAPDGMECAPPANRVFRAVGWAQRRLDPARAWMLTRGRSVTVAIVDTGVSRSAPALAGRVLTGQDVRTGGPANSDCSGHGTFVAGLVAARQVSGGPFAGVAPEARILPIRVSDRAEDVHPNLLAKGVEAAVRGGAKVIAVASAAPFGSSALQRAVAQAERRDAVVVASALTMRNQQGDVAYPAAYTGVVSVMAIGPDGSLPSAGQAYPPTLAAPGRDLVSIAPSGRGNVEGSAVNLAVGYVAGAAALVRAYLPRLPAAAVRDRLESTTDPATGQDPPMRSGVVDPVAAVTAVLPDAAENAPAPPEPAPVVLPPVPVVDRHPARAAAAWTGGVVLGGIAVSLIGSIIVRGRRRGWSANP